MKKLSILILSLVLGFFGMSQSTIDSLPQDYFQAKQAYEEKNRLLLQEDTIDIVLDFIDQVPLELFTADLDQYNYAIGKYNLPQVAAQRKGIIFVLDTEGKLIHPALAAAATPKYDKIYTNETSFGNVNGHGIHCAGIIGGEGVGLIYNYVRDGWVDIPVGKVLYNSGSGNFGDIVEGINDITAKVPQLKADGYDCIMISMSLGGSGVYGPVNDAIEAAKAAGILVVAASGNSGREPIGTPANAPDAYAIGSLDANDVKSSFSSFGEGQYIMSYGRNIYATYLNESFATLSGTSMSTPQQAALFMYIWITNEKLLTVDEVVNEAWTRDLGPAGYDIMYGHGISDPAKFGEGIPDEPEDDPEDNPDPSPGPDPENPTEIVKPRMVYYQVDSMKVQWFKDGDQKLRISHMDMRMGVKHPYESDYMEEVLREIVDGYFTNNRAFKLRPFDDERAMGNFAMRFFNFEMRNKGYEFDALDGEIYSEAYSVYLTEEFINHDLLRPEGARNRKYTPRRNKRVMRRATKRLLKLGLSTDMITPHTFIMKD